MLHQRWDAVRHQILARSTQTNEPARCGVLLPLLTEVSASHGGAPLALIELGASAGLCLRPDDWAYDYVTRDDRVLASLGTSLAGRIRITVKDDRLRLPRTLPPIASRVGLDLNPLAVSDPETRAWLRTLVWPGQDHRLARLDAALIQAAARPVRVVRGDLRDADLLAALLTGTPTGAIPVVIHTAVFAYLDDADRAACESRLAGLAASGACHWISYEGQRVLPGVAAAVAADRAMTAALRKGAFVVALDGVPRYQADGHADWVL